LTDDLLAVLEFKNRLDERDRKGIDVPYLSDKVRALVLESAPAIHVITRENVTELLATGGRKIEDCEGECEVETGRRLGATLVLSGDILRFGSEYKLTLRLHKTSTARLLGASEAAGVTADDLAHALSRSVSKLLDAAIGDSAAAAGAPAQAAPAVGAPTHEEPAQGRITFDIDTNALVARDAALKAEAHGKEKPGEALAAWKVLAAIRDRNPYRPEAEAKAREWATFVEEMDRAERQKKTDSTHLQKILPLSTVSTSLKAELLEKYRLLYGDTSTDQLFEAFSSGEGCALGNARSCIRQGKELRQKGDEVGARRAFDRGFDLLRKECDLQVGTACYDLVTHYNVIRADWRPDYHDRFTWYQKACNAGYKRACGIVH
jgi:hypothetical protein